ncbi:Ovate protein family [Vigna unguiculata]|uniref:Transcription repressor n=2 Tax=Vigna unguiculata TaxID=3917 RepID=A0A4D6MB27_VIGUN|nr:Ovate protein family [Vigna unguiculata]
MPRTGERRRKRNNLSRLNFNLCFSIPMQPFTPQSSPTATSSTVLQNQNKKPLSQPATSTSPIRNYDPTNPFPSLGPEPQPADLATAFVSQRFFFTYPGRSNSIVESTVTDTDCATSSSSPRNPVATVEEKAKTALEGSVAVEMYSLDPYADFRHSMEEMVAASPELIDVAANWKELLFCYLALNPKSTHKFILSAFSDLLLSLLSQSSPPPQDADAGDVPVGGDGCSN